MSEWTQPTSVGHITSIPMSMTKSSSTPTKHGGKSPESVLREELAIQMRGLWKQTWHETGAVSPGVPDSSYVMNGGGHETGWLELKATREVKPGGAFKWGIEPSQHQWIEEHEAFVPVHLLLRAGDIHFLVPGARHRDFVASMTYAQVRIRSVDVATLSGLRKMLYTHLRAATDRQRK